MPPFLGILVVESSLTSLAETKVSERRRESKVEGSSILDSKQLPFLIEQIDAQEEEEVNDHDCDDENDDKHEGDDSVNGHD